jgi:hypothetical protein
MLISFYFKIYFHLNKSTRADTVSTDQPEIDVALKKKLKRHYLTGTATLTLL